MTLRLTSATVTFSVTWSSPMIVSRLTICADAALLIGVVDGDAAAASPPAAVCEYWPVVASPPVTKIVARSEARLESSGVSTVPVSTTLSLSNSTVMSESGMKRFR